MKTVFVIIATLAVAHLACTTNDSEVAASGAVELEAEAEPADLPLPTNQESSFEADAVGLLWQWEGMTTPVEQVDVDDPTLYTIRFQPEGKVEIRADCNRGFGSYEVTEGRKLEFGPFGVTRAICPPESLSDRYLRELARATTLFLADGNLYLELPYDSGTLKFSRLAEEPADR